MHSVRKSLIALLGTAAATFLAAPPALADSFPVEIRIDASDAIGPLKPIWRFFGADEPNYATMPNGLTLLGELGELKPKEVYFRAHNLLTTGDGKPALKWGSTNAYREDDAGNPVYDWTIVDGIFDAYLENGVRPYVQIGFMPRDLSVMPDPYQHEWTPKLRYEEIFTGWAHPPRDYERWSELVYQWTQHCIDRYGRDEVETWYWQTWNEANAGYWQGTRDEFFKLHDYAVAGVRRALPTARVGGPDAAGSGGDWTRAFIEHCVRGKNHATGETGTPLDFVSFHAKGAPRYVDGRVRMGIAEQLRTVDDGFRIVASYPELKGTPVIIGECDPEGCAACQGPQLAYRNDTMYSSYTAASFARIHELADRHGVNLEGALTWAFEFEDQRLFAGFRSLATGGIDKAVLNVFRMMSRMAGDRLRVRSNYARPLDDVLKHGVSDQPEVNGMASYDRQRRELSMLLWHYHDDDAPGDDAEVIISIDQAPLDLRAASIRHFRVDQEHGNAYSRWKRMGSPAKPTAEQHAELIKAGQLAELPASSLTLPSGEDATLKLSLPRQAVSLIIVCWPR